MKAAEKKSGQTRHSLLVFDEVDAGIGGMTANEVGKKLKVLSGNTQLLVITHLHQIARLADNHFTATKTTDKDGRTRIEVRKLETDERSMELDRMVALPTE